MPKRRQLRSFDLKKLEGFEGLIGVDEVGRGALAGPVVAGAILVTRAFLEGKWAVYKAGRVNDSKLLAPADREALWDEFESLGAQGAIHANFGTATVEEIEQHNILGATKLAMRRALGTFAKLHFRTAYEVVKAAGKLDELPLPEPREKMEWGG